MISRAISFIIMVLLSGVTLGQSDSVMALPYEFIIKTEGVLKQVSATEFKAITTVLSLRDGRLVKPEGIIVLDSGKELVIKNGEYIDQNGVIHIAPDSLIRLVTIRYHQKMTVEYQKELRQYKELNALLYQKGELLQALCETIEHKNKSDNKTNLIDNQKVRIQQLNSRIISVDSEIKILENALKKQIVIRPAYF